MKDKIVAGNNSMKSLVQIIKEARRSSIRPDAKRGDESGVNTKNDTVPTVNITDEVGDGTVTKGPDGKMPYSKTKNIVNKVIQPFKEAALAELSPELVGKVNKERTIGDKPSKTPEAKKTLSNAVAKKWIASKVGVVKEARAGRPKKNATEDDPGSEHVMMQMRKVISLRGNHKITHVSGEKSDVTPAQAHKALAHHDNLKTSAEKDAYAKRLHRSAASMHDAMSGKAEVHKPKISLAGKITGTQKEGFVDVSPKTPIPHVTISKSAHSKSTNAPASSGPSQTAATNRSAQLQANAEKEANQKKKAAEDEIAKRNQSAAARKVAAPKPQSAPEVKPMGVPKPPKVM